MMTVAATIWIPSHHPPLDGSVAPQKLWDNSGTSRECDNEMLPQLITRLKVAAACESLQKKSGFLLSVNLVYSRRRGVELSYELVHKLVIVGSILIGGIEPAAEIS